MKVENYINELIVRNFSEETTPEEIKIIEDWLSKNQENRDYYNELKDIWLISAPDTHTTNFDVERALCEFKSQAGMNEKNNKRTFRHFLQYAALILLLLGIPLTYWISKNTGQAPDNITTVYCDYGDRTSIVLPDSSKVWLNSGSRITFNNNFNKGSRELYLEGEAYFAVEKDPENPFMVKTSNISVEVLGTEFNLKAYPDEAAISVTLVEGSLHVSNHKESAMIVPHQKLMYQKENHTISIENLSDLEPDTEWINGRLIFRNESLTELERKLERWFDVEIEFSDEQVKSRRFSGTLGRESILEVISYFASSQYVDYRISGNEVTFFSEK
jgi:transmembrane sensor